MANSGLTVNVRIEGVRETLQAFRRLPREASTALRKRSTELATDLAGRIASAARSDSRQSALVAGTVRARRDRVPVVTAGGAARVGRHRVPAHAILFGSEFGANRRTGWYAAERYADSTGRQYRPRLAKGSYWFFRTVEESEGDISQAWREAADDIARSFGEG